MRIPSLNNKYFMESKGASCYLCLEDSKISMRLMFYPREMKGTENQTKNPNGFIYTGFFLSLRFRDSESVHGL